MNRALQITTKLVSTAKGFLAKLFEKLTGILVFQVRTLQGDIGKGRGLTCKSEGSEEVADRRSHCCCCGQLVDRALAIEKVRQAFRDANHELRLLREAERESDRLREEGTR